MLEQDVKTSLIRLINEYSVPDDNLFIKINSELYIVCAKEGSTDEERLKLEELHKYSHLLQSSRDLYLKTKFAIEMAMKYCETIDPQRVNLFSNELTKGEFECYYYLEDALYRIEMLWDALAQIYNIYSGKNLDAKDIFYKRFFKSLEQDESASALLNVLEITAYLSKNDDGSETHHRLVDLRNTTTHRYSLSVTGMTGVGEENLRVRESEVSLLCAICSEFNGTMYFMETILVRILEDNKDYIEQFGEPLHVIR